jgi:hypothetical protein
VLVVALEPELELHDVASTPTVTAAANATSHRTPPPGAPPLPPGPSSAARLQLCVIIGTFYQTPRGGIPDPRPGADGDRSPGPRQDGLDHDGHRVVEELLLVDGM